MTPRSQGTNVIPQRLEPTSSAKARALCHGLLLKAFDESQTKPTFSLPASKKMGHVSPYVALHMYILLVCGEIPIWGTWCTWMVMMFFCTRNFLCFSCALLLYTGWLRIIKLFLLLSVVPSWQISFQLHTYLPVYLGILSNFRNTHRMNIFTKPPHTNTICGFWTF